MLHAPQQAGSTAGACAPGPTPPAAPDPDTDGEAAGWLARAFALAERGRRTASPNPLVGCVLVRDGAVVGEGWHERAGGPHAEVVALRAAGADAAGATAYVTLEPCAHAGRTGPCADALIAAGIFKVVAALADPNPLASGGAQRLRGAGVDVVLDADPATARRQNAVFLHGLRHARPFVIWKAAISLDGRIAAADGTSQWITGPEARAGAHDLRAEVDAVLVGSGTVLADDPALTARPGTAAERQPLRVVLDRRHRVPATARVHDGAAPTLILADPDPASVLTRLWDRDVRSVLLEGGGTVAGAFLAAGLVDRLILHVAPLLLGADATPVIAAALAPTLTAAPRLEVDSVRMLGGDVELVCTPIRKEPR